MKGNETSSFFMLLSFLPKPFKLNIDGDNIIYRNGFCTKRFTLSDLQEVYIKTTDKGPFACDVFFILVTNKGRVKIPQDLPACNVLLNKLQGSLDS